MIALRSGKTLVASALTVCSLLAFSGAASAQLTSCADILTSPPLASNPAIFSATSVQATTGGRNYCNVSIVYRDPALADPNNFTCGGNLEANIRAQCSMVKTPYKGEKGPITNNAEIGIPAALCGKLN